MPLIYQCGNCGNDHEDLNEQRVCIECNTETCGSCHERGLCYDCADAERNASEAPEEEYEFEDEE